MAEAEVADKVEMEEQVVHEAWQAEVVDMAQLVQVAQQAPPVQVAAEQIQMDLMAEVEAEEERLEVMVQMVAAEARWEEQLAQLVAAAVAGAQMVDNPQVTYPALVARLLPLMGKPLHGLAVIQHGYMGAYLE